MGPPVTPSAAAPFLSRLHNSRALPHLRHVLRQYELVERVKAYDPDADEALLNRAYVYTVQKHGTQKRASGDPYFSHPIEVAGLMTDLKLDQETIVTALLHDTVEDTLATIEDIEKNFGPDIAKLVDGVTKLSKIEQLPENERAAENLRKFLLAMSEDIRVLLVKLADRLHNMRTLHFIKSPEKRRRIARETMDIYAPLAERVGMYEYMREMQLLAFEQLEPEAYATITGRLEQITELGERAGRRIALDIKQALAAGGIKAEVWGGEKHPFSIWKKMAERHVSFEQITDIFAFRVLTEKSRTATARSACTRRGSSSRALQGLHLDAEDQRLPQPAHHADLRELDAGRSADPHARDAPAQRVRPRRALGLQAGRPARRAGRLAARPDRDRRRQPRRRGAARAHAAGDLPGPHLRLHPQGRAVPAAQGRDPGRLRLRGAHRPRRAPSAPRSTAGTCR